MGVLHGGSRGKGGRAGSRGRGGWCVCVGWGEGVGMGGFWASFSLQPSPNAMGERYIYI